MRHEEEDARKVEGKKEEVQREEENRETKRSVVVRE